jgi:predicted MFS family arabinose efflux permease
MDFIQAPLLRSAHRGSGAAATTRITGGEAWDADAAAVRETVEGGAVLWNTGGTKRWDPEQGVWVDPAAAGCYRWLVVLLALVAVLVLIVQRMTLSVAIIPWAAECGWSAAQQQVQLSAFSFGYLLTMLPGAMLATRYTAHVPALAAILVLSSLGAAATPLAGCSHGGAAALRAALGLAQGPMFPVAAGLIGQWVRPTEYSRASAFMSEGSNLGVLVAFPLTSLLCAAAGWRAAFYASVRAPPGAVKRP